MSGVSRSRRRLDRPAGDTASSVLDRAVEGGAGCRHQRVAWAHCDDNVACVTRVTQSYMRLSGWAAYLASLHHALSRDAARSFGLCRCCSWNLFVAPSATRALASMAGNGAVQGDAAQFTELREGQARILLQGNEAFYNKAQVQNRDLSIAVIRQFAELRAAELDAGRGPRHLVSRRQRARAAQGASDDGATAEGQPALADAPGPSGQAEGCGGDGAEDAGAAPDRRLRVLEALGATGLRSIRYALELGDTVVREVVCNDMSHEAVASMRRNIAHNGPAAERIVTPSQSDARVLMLQAASEAGRTATQEGLFDVIDIDPYGAPVQFLDAAVQAVSDGGLLCVTATDMAVLCGNTGEACYAKYGSYPLHRAYGHEQGIRILLACLESNAARHKRYIVPLLSLHMDFYVRVFVRIFTSPRESKNAACKLAYVYQSQGCSSFFLQRVGERQGRGQGTKYTPGHGPVVPERCPETDAPFLMGGPLWADPIHDMAVARNVLSDVEARGEGQYPAASRVAAVLTNVLEELPDTPLYLDMHELCRALRATAPKADVLRSAIVNAGYRVSSCHASPLGLKTDAPWHVIWDIMRCWVRQTSAAAGSRPPDPGSYMAKLLSKPPKVEASFARNAAALSAAKAARKNRFPPNPEEHWGPQRRHGRPALKGHAVEKARSKGEEGNGVTADGEATDGQGEGAGAGAGPGVGADAGAGAGTGDGDGERGAKRARTKG